MEIKELELKAIKGGAGVSATLISGVVRGVNSFLDLGRSLGTAIRRLSDGSICPL